VQRTTLLHAAEQDIDAATLWYEREREGLGERFIDEVTLRIESLRENPGRFPVVSRTCAAHS